MGGAGSSALLLLKMSLTLASRSGGGLGRWGKTQKEQFEESPVRALLQAALWKCLECFRESYKGCFIVTPPLLSGAPEIRILSPRGRATARDTAPGCTREAATLLHFVHAAPLQDRFPPPPNFSSETGSLLSTSVKSKIWSGGIWELKILGKCLQKQEFIYSWRSINWFNPYGEQLGNQIVKYEYS